MNDSGAAAQRSTDAGRECEARWASIQAEHGRDVAALKAKWIGVQATCAGTGVYEYHLATLAELEGRFDDAISILQKALNNETPRRDQIYVTMLGMRFNKADSARPRDVAASRAANQELEAFLKEKPGFTPAIHVAASQRARLHDFAAAEKLARKGLESEPSNPLSSSALVVSLAATERCSEAKPLIRPALEKHEILFEDYDFMMAAAFCYYSTGDILTAEQVLLALKAKLPGSDKEESFKRLARVVLQEKASSQPK